MEEGDAALLSISLGRIAKAIYPNAAGSLDAAGGRVESLTEAIMGITSGLYAIAAAIESLADAHR